MNPVGPCSRERQVTWAMKMDLSHSVSLSVSVSVSVSLSLFPLPPHTHLGDEDGDERHVDVSPPRAAAQRLQVVVIDCSSPRTHHPHPESQSFEQATVRNSEIQDAGVS